MAILNRGTLILMGCAIALGGAVLLLENRPETESASSNVDSGLVSNDSQDTGKLLFAFAEADVESFTLSRPGETLAFIKDDNDFWQMTSPQSAEAEAGAIAFLLNQLTSTSVRSLEVAPGTLERFGLIEPEVSIELVAAGQPYEFLVGDADFTGEQRYVRAVPADDAIAAADELIEIHLVPGSITNAVERPTEEWLVTPETAEGSSSEPSEPSIPSTGTQTEPDN